MVQITFPAKLQTLLDQNQGLSGWITSFAQRAGEIFRANDLIFFPGFTDHGIAHIEAVLKTEVELVPEAVWENKVLSAVDASVIIGATILHDIAMHLNVEGFLELVKLPEKGNQTRFKPLRWFDQDSEGHHADRPWAYLWEEYQREARRFSDFALSQIVGIEAVRTGWKYNGLPEASGEWSLNHRLVVGEFIRRHHARLAHEIAMSGFPGLKSDVSEGAFPALATESANKELADLIGLVARSHGMDLRVCLNYLEATPIYKNSPRPMNCAVLYPMALLRVADYLQIKRERAPAVLLQLKDIKSPVSKNEWNKHQAVLSISEANDLAGRHITIGHNIDLETFLQMRDLIAGLQREMDHSTAVLEERYGRYKDECLDELKLKYRRVHSNVNDSAFQRELPYVPERTGFSADPKLLSLLVAPLYGDYPGVGVRELMQNAVDAVRELDTWCKDHGKRKAQLDLPQLNENADVLIDFVKRQDGSWILRIQDRGIGMTAETLQHYFLRGGASLRQNREWSEQFSDTNGRSKVMKSGRFGIGTFAIFLLGSKFTVTTRYVGDSSGKACQISAEKERQNLEIRYITDQKIGTTIEVELNEGVVRRKAELERAADNGLHPESDWFCLAYPKVVRRVDLADAPRLLKAQYEKLTQADNADPQPMTFHPKGYQSAHWFFDNFPNLVCNGIRIAAPAQNGNFRDAHYYWPEDELLLKRPGVAVNDGDAMLPLTTQRYELETPELPFLQELTDEVLLSFIAHTLVCGPSSRAEALMYGVAESPKTIFPLSGSLEIFERKRGPSAELSLDRWISSLTHFVPFDPWLRECLPEQPFMIYSLEDEFRSYGRHYLEEMEQAVVRVLAEAGCTILKWDGSLDHKADYRRNPSLIRNRYPKLSEQLSPGSGWLAYETVLATGKKLDSFEIVISAYSKGRFSSRHDFRGYVNTKEISQSWSTIPDWESGRKCWFLEKKKSESSGQLGDGKLSKLPEMLRRIEKGLLKPRSKRKEDDMDRFSDVIALAFVQASAEEKIPGPEFPIAKIWNEILGHQAVPFDVVARGKLIQQAREHSDLGRHIRAWEAVRR